MLITKTVQSDNVTLSLEGNLDTFQSVQLSDEMEKIFSEGNFNIYLDLKELSFVSSSGLRVMLATQKKVVSLGKKFEMFGANETIKEVLKITGFSNLLSIR